MKQIAMVKATLPCIILLFIMTDQCLVSSIANDKTMSIFDPEFQAQNEEIYGISADEYLHYIIPQQFIVGFNETIVSDTYNVKQYVHSILKNGGFVNATALWFYQTSTLVGVTIAGVDDALYTVLEHDANVLFIEPDSLVTLDSITTTNWQSDPPNWGLDRIDRLLLFNEGKALDHRYNFDQTGQGAYVFLFDTGIRWGHEEFKNDPDAPSRVICGFDAFNFDNKPEDWNNGCYDGVGHGTHIASIVGGSVYGVAKDVALVSVKVFTGDGRGSVGSVLAGLNYLLEEKEAKHDTALVANLSFGTPVAIKIFRQVLESLISKDIIVTASGGNEASDACNKLPGSIPGVLTIGASTIDDEIAKFTNTGPCLDLFAPGDRITAAWRGSNFDRATLSGTSQSSAFAAGVVALLLELDPTMKPSNIKDFLFEIAEIDALMGIPEGSETLNLLLNMGGLELTT